MKFKRLFIAFSILVLVGFLIAYFFIFKNPAVKALDNLLSLIQDKPQASIEKYISPELTEDPFLGHVARKGIILDYKIRNTQRIEKNILKVDVSLSTKYGKIESHFFMEKLKDKWLVSQFPKVSDISGAMPIDMQPIENGNSEYTLNIRGTKLKVFIPSAYDKIQIGKPISLVLIDDYIADYKELAPLELKKIVASSKDFIEDAYLGTIPITSSLSIYQTLDNLPAYMDINILPIGIKDAILYHSPSKEDRDLIACIDHLNLPKDTIRIALGDNEYKSLIHPKAIIYSEGDLVIKNLLDNIAIELKANTKAVFQYNSEKKSLELFVGGKAITESKNRFYIASKEKKTVVIENINRKNDQKGLGTPYRGSMELALRDEGIAIINELSIEEYLYSVVPSEMPIKFGLESLKVQSIAARSYAARCFESLGYSGLGAHVDDSTSSQVYNNIEESPIAIQAVEETKGLISVFEGEIIDARFFSTSYGYTANFHETWSSDDVFPSVEIPYLTANPQFSEDSPSLYNEENFRAFMDRKDLSGYDKFSPFFRWTLTMEGDQIESLLKRNLSMLQEKQAPFILTREEDGSFQQKKIPEDMGLLQNITVISRGQGGNIMELEITTTRGIFKIVKELNIRQLLAPVNYDPESKPIEIHRHDGSIIKDFPIMPSAFFYIDINRNNKGNISEVIFTGGGYGHGVGMSQYGTYGLSLLGKTYSEIIEHYYPGSHLERLY